MGEPIAVLALRRKRDQISGVIAEYEKKIREAQQDLAHVNASLRLFELSGDPREFPAYIDLNRILRRGENPPMCIAGPTAGRPPDTPQSPPRPIKVKGGNRTDKVLAPSI